MSWMMLRCDRLKECLEIERAEREEVEAGLGTEVCLLVMAVVTVMEVWWCWCYFKGATLRLSS